MLRMDLIEKISISTLCWCDKMNHSYLQQNFEYKAVLREDPCKVNRHLYFIYLYFMRTNKIF